jgi:hypothetical protein
MSDEEFRSKFSAAVPEELIEGYEPPRASRRTDDGTYPDAEEAQAKLAERESASRLPPSEPSLLKLASQAITPKLPADQPASDDGDVGSAPTEPAPLPVATPKASTEGVSAAPVSANTAADSTATKAEASSHG